eukprot:3346432-Heterocapsa_arctica.AAC.1
MERQAQESGNPPSGLAARHAGIEQKPGGKCGTLEALEGHQVIPMWWSTPSGSGRRICATWGLSRS